MTNAMTQDGAGANAARWFVFELVIGRVPALEWPESHPSLQSAEAAGIRYEQALKAQGLAARVWWSYPLSHGEAVARIGDVRHCLECGAVTRGSIGAAGIRWRSVCQPCKDAADSALAGSVRALAWAAARIGGAR
jgi:hypothetical protein